MKPITIELTPDQAQKYEAIKWLLNIFGPRGSGRTHLMAMAFIEHSLNFDTDIEIFNHDQGFRGTREIMHRIQNIVSSHDGLVLSIKNPQGNRPIIRVKREEITLWNPKNPYQKE